MSQDQRLIHTAAVTLVRPLPALHSHHCCSERPDYREAPGSSDEEVEEAASEEEGEEAETMEEDGGNSDDSDSASDKEEEEDVHPRRPTRSGPHPRRPDVPEIYHAPVCVRPVPLAHQRRWLTDSLLGWLLLHLCRASRQAAAAASRAPAARPRRATAVQINYNETKREVLSPSDVDMEGGKRQRSTQEDSEDDDFQARPAAAARPAAPRAAAPRPRHAARAAAAKPQMEATRRSSRDRAGVSYAEPEGVSDVRGGELSQSRGRGLGPNCRLPSWLPHLFCQLAGGPALPALTD